MKSGRITAVHRDTKNKHRYHFYIGDELVFSVHEDILVKYQLMKGTEIDQAFLQEVLLAEEEHRAYLLALRYLGIRPRTSKQIASYLKEKGYPQEIAETIVSRCQQMGYLDDQAFARQWVSERMRLKQRSPLMLKMELQQRGIDKDLAEHALRGVTSEDELSAARVLVEKKLRRHTGELDRNEEQKILAMLYRKGFSQSVIQAIRRELGSYGRS
ncbi:RecX family transcriptional regulator [Brevibacillus composti]|uniref:Regulatory protein RecX n=1 Tax=Brevibacillus composti TaxID=2796470 RepID=A0A7T5JQJ4_9BACL|nr:RecX family transcriptional regulator [Brevibacillus composti]QQE76215.1 RecX family transcriptional regulator [Brevibacillus composti]QUO43244.1 RecX family transcriptional regulator [Brevibacillus composti]